MMPWSTKPLAIELPQSRAAGGSGHVARHSDGFRYEGSGGGRAEVIVGAEVASLVPTNLGIRRVSLELQAGS